MLAAEQNYRKAAETLSKALGVSISHETIHQDVQVAGEHLKKWDKAQPSRAASLAGKGTGAC